MDIRTGCVLVFGVFLASFVCASFTACALETTAIELDNLRITVNYPKVFKAYTNEKITYTIEDVGSKSLFGRISSLFSSSGPVAIQFVTNEDPERAQGKSYHDLNIPGHMDMQVEYIGSITAHWDRNKESKGEFPPVKKGPLVRSNTVEIGDWIFFKFKVTNTGDTIWDGEGFASLFVEPGLELLDSYQRFTDTRQYITKPVYPGESIELTVGLPGKNSSMMRVETDTPYMLSLRFIYRSYSVATTQQEFWIRPCERVFFKYVQPVTFVKTEQIEPVLEKECEVQVLQDYKTLYFGKQLETEVEEFMSAHRYHRQRSRDMDGEHTLNLMAQPWANALTVRIITKDKIVVKHLDIEVDDSTVALEFNPDNAWTVEKDGKPYPVLMSKFMPALRESYHVSDEPDKYIADSIERAMGVGTNVAHAMTNDWILYYDRNAPDGKRRLDGWTRFAWTPNFENFIRECRERGLPLIWSARYLPLYQPLEEIAFTQFVQSRQDRSPRVLWSDPAFPDAMGALVDWILEEYGDVLYRTADGRVPILIDDRFSMAFWSGLYSLSSSEFAEFQSWLSVKYDNSIARLNKAWSTAYASFKDIKPPTTVNQQELREICAVDGPYAGWGQAAIDLHDFRSEFYLKHLAEIRMEIQRRHPEVLLGLLTESHQLYGLGRELTGDPINDYHYYINRVHAVIPEVLEKYRPVDFIGDYNMFQATPELLRESLSEMNKMGIDHFYLPAPPIGSIMFEDDFAVPLQVTHGVDESISGTIPVKLRWATRLQPLFPLLKAMYEEGGLASLDWGDLSAGFVTETQIMEMEYFTEAARKMLDAVSTDELSQSNPMTASTRVQNATRKDDVMIHPWFVGASFLNDGSVRFNVAVENNTKQPLKGSIETIMPEGWNCNALSTFEVDLQPRERVVVECMVQVPSSVIQKKRLANFIDYGVRFVGKLGDEVLDKTIEHTRFMLKQFQ